MHAFSALIIIYISIIEWSVMSVRARFVEEMGTLAQVTLIAVLCCAGPIQSLVVVVVACCCCIPYRLALMLALHDLCILCPDIYVRADCHASVLDQCLLLCYMCLSAWLFLACRSPCSAWKDAEVSLHACVNACRLSLHASLFIHLDQHQLSEVCCMWLLSLHVGVHAVWKNPEASLTHTSLACMHPSSCNLDPFMHSMEGPWGESSHMCICRLRLDAFFFIQPRSVYLGCILLHAI